MNCTTGKQIVNEGKFFYINILISEECGLWDGKYHDFALTICVYVQTHRKWLSEQHCPIEIQSKPCNSTFSSSHIKEEGEKKLI